MIKHLLGIVLILCAAMACAAEVNRADQATLEKIKGIGPGLSERIVRERKSRPFKDWSDLMRRVPGIGVGGAVRLSAQGLTVNFLRYEDED